MAQDRGRECIARIKAGRFKVLQDVVEGRQANADLFGDVGPGCLFAITCSIASTVATATTEATLELDELAELGDTFCWFERLAVVARGKHLQEGMGCCVAFWVNEGVVQWFNAIGNFEETCCLDEGGRSKARNLL